MKIEDVPFGSVIVLKGQEYFLYYSSGGIVKLMTKKGHITTETFGTEVTIKYRPDLVKLRDAIDGKHYTLKGSRVVVRNGLDGSKIAVELANCCLTFEQESILEDL